MPGPLHNGKVIDIHTHILSQDPGSGCYLSPILKRRPPFRFFKRRYGLEGDLSLPHQKRYLINLLKHTEIHHKLNHGSDFPLPINASGFMGHLPVSKILKINRIESPIQRDFMINKELGFPTEAFTRGGEIISR
jgi:hypothetical protein